MLDRFRCLVAIAGRNPEVRGVPVWSGLASLLSWYGLHRFALRLRMKPRRLNEGYDWIALEGYGLAWPRAAPLARLASTLVELRVPGNPHSYFDGATRVRPGDTVLDIGACEGSFAVEALVRHGASRAWCFEPDPLMAEALHQTARGNSLEDRLQVAPAALSNHSGEATLLMDTRDPLVSQIVTRPAERPAGSTAPAGRTAVVEMLSLDEWVQRTGLDRVDFIKIDAEGADLSIVEGASATLARWRPTIAVTTYHRAEHALKITGFLSSLGLGYRPRVRGLNVFERRARPMMLLAPRPGPSSSVTP